VKQIIPAPDEVHGMSNRPVAMDMAVWRSCDIKILGDRQRYIGGSARPKAQED
jgi:hypothetical protein